MFFDNQVSKEVKGYGVGTTAAKGRYHLLASLEEAGRVQMLCVSNPKKINGGSKKPVKWFKDETRAVQALRSHKHACQKCLRSIETVEMRL